MYVRIARVKGTKKGKVQRSGTGKVLGGPGVDGRKRYVLLRDPESKKWQCTCPACQYSKGKARKCKHMIAFWNGSMLTTDVQPLLDEMPDWAGEPIRKYWGKVQ